jgi:hypothetical protein
MPCNELDKACQKVGRFLHDFAEVEHEINEGIVSILDLKSDAANVVHSIDFFKKVNILRIIANDTAPEEEKPKLKDVFSAIASQNNSRLIMAHCPFESAPDEGVQFKRTTANDGKITVHDPLWTPKMFADASKKLNELRDVLRGIRPRLTLTIGERGSKLSQYLYTPASNFIGIVEDAKND